MIYLEWQSFSLTPVMAQLHALHVVDYIRVY